MDYRRFETNLSQSYDRGADQYRRDDEIEARSENHQRLGGNLRRMCRSFGRPVRVLEMGCGTGRYFHWLDNTELLVGTDISAEMLNRAKQPVHASQVTAREVRLIRSNLYEMKFEPQSFDFIYSLGVFGYGAAITSELCAKIHSWLAPGGRLYFDALERRDSGRVYEMKQSMKSAVLPFLPGSVRQRVEARRQEAVPVCNHTRAEIEQLMTGSGFDDFVISSNTCHSPLWTGMHLECCARKMAQNKNSGSTHANADLRRSVPASV